MNILLASNVGLWQQIGNWLSTPSLQLFLLIGFAILTIGLLILMMTRWGHDRPVVKCVVLSVVAHILLFGYAYGTRLIFQYPAMERQESMTVKLVGYDVEIEDEEDLANEEEPEESPKPWDQVSTPSDLPDVDQLDRPALDSELEIERVIQPDPLPALPEPAIEQVDPNVASGNSEPLFGTPELSEVQPSTNPGVVDGEAFELESPNVEAHQIGFRRRQQDENEPGPVDILDSVDNSFEPVPDDSDSRFDEIRSEREPIAAIESDVKQFATEFLDESSELFPSEDVLPKAQPTPVQTPAAEDNQPTKRFAKISAPRRLGDGQPIPKLYQLRTSPNLVNVAVRRGGNHETQRAVERALQWLAQHQKADGRWDPVETGGGRENKTLGHDRRGAGANADSGITALAALALLGSGNTHLEGPYQSNLQAALEYLIRQQKADGNLAGDARLFARMYCHSMALLALSEALAVTGDQRLLPAVQRGVDFTVASQNKVDGGWRYQPQDRGDMSQFGWQVMALHSASIGGVPIPQNTIERMHTFLELCVSGQHRGLASYRPGQGVSTTMTAEAMLCRFFMQTDISPDTIKQAGDLVVTDLPSTNRLNYYYWYYATMALYHSGGDNWNRWNSELKRTLLPLQVQSGRDRGSWPATGPWSGYGGKVYSTAMATLCLEVYYRYLPIYEIADDTDR